MAWATSTGDAYFESCQAITPAITKFQNLISHSIEGSIEALKNPNYAVALHGMAISSPERVQKPKQHCKN